MKKIYTTFIIFLCPIFLFSQISPEKIINQPLASGANVVLTADLDGDGSLDLLTASEKDNKVAWHQNIDGLGTFSSQKTISILTNGLQSIAVGDMDGDGDTDVLAGAGNRIVWHENEDGLATFSDPKMINASFTLNDVYSILTGDIDGDGDLDVISASRSDDKVAWYENVDGLGTFGPQKIITTEADGARSVSIGDLDGDGDLDVLYASQFDDEVAWYKNEDGLGTFSFQDEFSGLTSPFFVTNGDLDGDGDLDVLTAAGSLSWYENEDGQGSFGLKNTISSATLGLRHISVADIDGDGDLDVLSASTLSPKIAWYENENGLGTFGPQNIISILATGARFVSTGDVDNDGDLDVLSASFLDSKIAWYENEDGQGSFGSQNSILPLFANNLTAISVGDLNGDGNLDVVSSSDLDDKIAWYENENGQNNFSAQKLISDLGNEPQSVCVGDLDNDGDLDVLSASKLDDKISWFENQDGLGSFSAQIIISSDADGARFVSVGDLDGDGDLDVLSASASDAKIAWYENQDGQGSFSSENIITDQATGANFVAVGDLDGDGDLDVLSTSSFNDEIAWYENEDGLGSFGLENIIYTSAGNPQSLSVGDIDGDGDLDLVYASFDDDKISWFENEDDQGSFSNQKIISSLADEARSVNLVDIDTDGDLDVVAATKGNNRIVWYENQDTMFSTRKIINASANGAQFVTVGDMDNDGDLDIFSASQEDNKIAWYENYFNQIKLHGTVFFDENENGLLDVGEQGLNNQEIQTDPNTLWNWTNDFGEFKFALANGDYDLSIQPTPEWISTTPDLVSVTIAEIPQQVTQNFGLTPAYDLTSLNIDLTSAPTRCGFAVPFWLNISNIGTEVSSGTITLELDNLIDYIDADPLPVSINGNTLVWDFVDLFPTYDEQIKLLIGMPGVLSIGEPITIIATVEAFDDNSIPIFTNVYDFNSFINCAYDPNDKLVEPDFLGDDNYTLMADSFLYTIRFQNTGTDTAFTVMLEDHLDPNLDWTTFRPISSSHPFEVFLFDDGMLEFTFNNIMLPDSNVNEAGSHGFVKYEIFPNSGLAENTIIENKADIYFDFNPPIATNTTENIMIETFDADEDGFIFLDDCDDMNPGINPGATEIPNNGIDEDCDELDLITNTSGLEDFQVSIFPNPTNGKVEILLSDSREGELSILDYTGKLISHKLLMKQMTIDISNYPAGIYIFNIRMKNGTLHEKIIKH